jgi:hypothetical protein
MFQTIENNWSRLIGLQGELFQRRNELWSGRTGAVFHDLLLGAQLNNGALLCIRWRSITKYDDSVVSRDTYPPGRQSPRNPAESLASCNSDRTTDTVSA